MGGGKNGRRRKNMTSRDGYEDGVISCTGRGVIVGADGRWFAPFLRRCSRSSTPECSVRSKDANALLL